MDARMQAAPDYHSDGRLGKVEVVPTKPVATARDLSLAYSPGLLSRAGRSTGTPLMSSNTPVTPLAEIWLRLCRTERPCWGWGTSARW